MKISLNGGAEVVFDDRDSDFVSGFKWSKLQGAGNHIYAITRDLDPPVLMHRMLMRPGPKECVDHINGNGLDNRRSNLRVCTRSQNLMNRGLDRRNKSGFKGVYLDKKRGLWMAQARANGKAVHLGGFDSAESAASRYDDFILEVFGEFAKTNQDLGLL